MPWLNLATLLALLKRAHKDPQRYTVYIPDSDLPVPPPPRNSPRPYEIDEVEDESTDFEPDEE